MSYVSTPFRQVVDRLEEKGLCPENHGSYVKAFCPAHDDQEQKSLSVRDMNGDAAPKCFVGCGFREIAAALGLEPKDFFQQSAPTGGSETRIVATYDYTDEEGRLLFQTVRFHPKDFRQRQPRMGGGWTWNMKGVRRVPYRLPAVLKAVRNGDVIFIVEGEKDCEGLAVLGLTATTSPMGAGKWRKDFSPIFKDARVVILPDNDSPGRRHAQDIACKLHGVATQIRILPLSQTAKEKADVSDWIEEHIRAGWQIDRLRGELLQLAEAEPEWVGSPMASTSAKGSLPDSDYTFTDTANADRFIARHGRDFRHCEKLRCWLYWDGARFAEDWLNQAKASARETARNIYAEAAEAAQSKDQDAEQRAKALADHATRSLSNAKLDAMLAVAKVDKKVAVEPSSFDQDAFRLNTPSGLLDLDTGEFRPHRAKDRDRPMVSKVTGAAYDPGVTCPRWQRFLQEVFVDHNGQPDEDLLNFIQVAVGYSLSASTREHALFILHGGGSNGKTVFVETLGRVLGDYSHTLQFDSLLTQKTGNQNHPDIADLRGKRIAWASESAIGARFNEALLKQLSGGDKITAARKYANPITFQATHKLWLASNHPPRTYDSSDAFWRRVYLVPFRVKFCRPEEYHPDHRLERLREPDLDQALEEELPGILRWAIDGFRRWRKEGLRSCAAVTDATAEYRADQDPLSGYLEDCCILDKGATAPVPDLYEAYEAWCERAGESAKDRRAFGKLLTERGIGAGKSGSKRVRKGIRLRRPDEEPLQSDGTSGTSTDVSSPATSTDERRFPESDVPTCPTAPGKFPGTDVPTCPTAPDWDIGTSRDIEFLNFPRKSPHEGKVSELHVQTCPHVPPCSETEREGSVEPIPESSEGEDGSGWRDLDEVLPGGQP